MKFSTGLAAIVTLISVSGVSAISEWGQCGGINWTGTGTCDAGLTCNVINPYYYQCLKSTGSTTTTSKTTSLTSTTKITTSTTSTKPTTSTTSTKTTTSTSSSASPTSTGRVKFQYFGVNESSAEFGNNVIPGVLGTHYTWPTTDSVDFFLAKGFNTFRIAFLMERISPPGTGLTGPFDATYLAALKTIATYVTSKGGYAVLDPHNFLRYNGAVLSDTAAFATWWKNLASQFKSDPKIIFDIQNEPYEIAATSVFSMMQSAVNGIRSSGATSQLILVEGTSWSGAHSWISSGNGAAFTGLSDPNKNIAVEMHQYLDSDNSGTSATCVSATIGAERVAAATAWLKQYGFKGFLGEVGGGSNDVCIAAVKGLLTALQAPGTPWIGALWWAAGPWWGDYFQSIEPPNGAAIPRILPEALIPFL